MSSQNVAHTTTVSATCIALATLIPVAFYQCHALDHLPDPPGAWFDSDRITKAKSAHPFGIPDSLLGIASYGATLALILCAKESKMARTMLRAKLLGDGSIAAINVTRQVVSFRRLCSWCTGTAIATAAMIVAGHYHLKD
jgi:uncharacterized membrane protein